MFKAEENVIPEIIKLIAYCEKVLEDLANRPVYRKISEVCNTLKFRRLVRLEPAAKEKWFKFIKKCLAKGNHSQALFLLGYFYQKELFIEKDKEMGLIFVKDHKKAIEYYERSIALNNSYAMTNCAQMRSLGIGCEKDNNKAIELLEKAIVLSNPQAMIDRAHIHQEYPDPSGHQESVSLFHRAIAMGSMEAKVGLALSHQEGVGCEKDLEKALYLLEAAEASGNVNAKFYLATLYYTIGGKQNLIKAFDLLEQAVELGRSHAMFFCAIMHLQGKNKQNSINKAQAIILFEKALRCGISLAEDELKKINIDMSLAHDILVSIWDELTMGYVFSDSTLNALNVHSQEKVIANITDSPLSTSLYFLRSLKSNKHHPLSIVLEKKFNKLPRIDLLLFVREILLRQAYLSEDSNWPLSIEINSYILDYLQPGYEFDRKQGYQYPFFRVKQPNLEAPELIQPTHSGKKRKKAYDATL